MKRHEVDVLNGSIGKNLILFTIPLILTGILQLLYNAADIIVVGQFAGSNSVAAVGATASLTGLLVNLFLGLSTGASVSVANCIGAKDFKATHKTVHTAITLALIGGIILAIIGFVFSKPLLILMNTPYDIIDEAALYMKIIFLGMPANIVYNFGAAILRAKGDTKNPLIFLSIAGIINVILNLFFVILFNMGAEGVGIATITSQLISAVFVVVHLSKLNDETKLSISKLRIYKYPMLKILRIGIPAGLHSILFSISNTLIQSSINSFGSDVIAGNSAAINLEGFAYTTANSMNQTLITFLGQNHSANKYSRIKRIMLTAFIQNVVITTAISLLIILLRKPLITLYIPKNPVVISYGMDRIVITLSMYFTLALMECFTGSLRGLGYSFVPMLTSVFGVCGIRIFWVFFIFPIFNTPASLYISYPVSWIVTDLIFLPYLIYVYKKTVSKELRTKNAAI